MLAELRRHGYELSTGTLNPLPHALLTSGKEWLGGSERRAHRATPAGRKAPTAANANVRELFGELFEEEGDRGR